MSEARCRSSESVSRALASLAFREALAIPVAIPVILSIQASLVLRGRTAVFLLFRLQWTVREWAHVGRRERSSHL